MKVIQNPWRIDAEPNTSKRAPNAPFPSVAVHRVTELLQHCPAAQETPLGEGTALAPVTAFWIKDERRRMNLGSFKALGAAYVIARAAAAIAEEHGLLPGSDTLNGTTYITASAGNHGMSVAAGARVFGAKAIIYIAETVPESFAERLKDQGAEVRREGADYAASMKAAEHAAARREGLLLSDSSWDGYIDPPYLLMEGYLQMAAEASRQCPEIPSHIMLQAGVGGLACAVAAYARHVWGNAPVITIVEPKAAPALQASILAGKATFAPGPESSMGRLDCKEPSLIALNGLARDADFFLTLDDEEVESCLPAMAEAGFATTPSGGAGVAAVMHNTVRQALHIDETSRLLCFLSEAPEDKASQG